jgi:hypothetical protein
VPGAHHYHDNAIIPLKERVVDRFYDPVTRLCASSATRGSAPAEPADRQRSRHHPGRSRGGHHGVEMPDWEVTQHRVALIHFDGQSWRSRTRPRHTAGFATSVVPCGTADEYVNGRQIEYGAAYVDARDQHIVSSRRTGHVTFLLRGLTSIGFLSAARRQASRRAMASIRFRRPSSRCFSSF